MKCLRQILRVSRTIKRTKWVLETAGVSKSLLAFVKERKLAYYTNNIYEKAEVRISRNAPERRSVARKFKPV